MDGLLIGQMEYIKEKLQIVCSVTETSCLVNISGLVPLKMMRCKKTFATLLRNRSKIDIIPTIDFLEILLVSAKRDEIATAIQDHQVAMENGHN